MPKLATHTRAVTLQAALLVLPALYTAYSTATCMHLGPPTALLAALPLKCMGTVGSGNLCAWSRLLWLLWLGGAYALTATLDRFLRLGSSFHM